MRRLLLLSLVLLPFFGFAQKNISVAEAMQLINETKHLQIVDVRTQIEFDSAYVKNAINIDYKNPKFQENILTIDKEQPVLVYCRSGKRSFNAMNIMIQLGYKEVYNMQGGILAFKKEFPNCLSSNLK